MLVLFRCAMTFTVGCLCRAWKRVLKACSRDAEAENRPSLMEQAAGSELRQLRPTVLDECSAARWPPARARCSPASLFGPRAIRVAPSKRPTSASVLPSPTSTCRPRMPPGALWPELSRTGSVPSRARFGRRAASTSRATVQAARTLRRGRSSRRARGPGPSSSRWGSAAARREAAAHVGPRSVTRGSSRDASSWRNALLRRGRG